jgi:hypothetical protein
MPTALQLLVREFLAHPEIVEARRRASRRDRYELLRDGDPSEDEGLTVAECEALERELTRIVSVRHGSWRAEDVEPYLKPLGSSLDPRSRGPNYVDVRGLSVLDLGEEL